MPNMSTIDKNFYFDIKDRSKMPFQVYIGGRGIGKSYSALRELALSTPPDEKFIYLRRTGKEIDGCSTAFGNPFKTINRDFHQYLEPMPGGKGAATFFCDVRDEDNPIIRGYAVALSTFAGLRSMDLSDVSVTVFDEFIPERQVKKIKAEGEALLNFYETVNRNREFQGREPMKLILLSNALDLSNPILETLGIIGVLENMIEHKEHRRTIPERELYVERVGKLGVTNAKEKTVLYKLANADWTNDTLNADFLSADLSTIIKSPNLRNYKPEFRFGEWVCFSSKEEYYIGRSTVTCSINYPEQAGFQVRAFFAPLYRQARGFNRIIFDAYTTQVFFDELMGWNKIST